MRVFLIGLYVLALSGWLLYRFVFKSKVGNKPEIKNEPFEVRTTGTGGASLIIRQGEKEIVIESLTQLFMEIKDDQLKVKILREEDPEMPSAEALADTGESEANEALGFDENLYNEMVEKARKEGNVE